MNAVVMMFFGAGMGMGLLLLVQALRPQSQPIHEVFASVATEGRGYTETARDRSQRSFRDTVGSVGSTLAIASSDEAQLRKDLAVTASTWSSMVWSRPRLLHSCCSVLMSYGYCSQRWA